MNLEYITVPPGLLNAWGGVQPNNASGTDDATETFDAQDVAIGRSRRALSVSLGGLGRTRETGLETIANAFPILGAPRSFTRDETTVEPRGPPLTRRPQRSATITIGSLARSDATSTRTSTASTRRPSNAEQLGLRKPEPAITPNQAADNSYMFQSLNNYRFPGTKHNVTPSLPVFIGREFDLNGRSSTDRRDNSEVSPNLWRVASDRSWIPGLDVIRRASIAIDDTLENLTSLARRSTLADVYEKAKVRQVQLRRSTVVQIGFQYCFYLLILASIYFILVGVPLWKGVVWYIYIIFSTKLAVPVGTAVFLGIGFLYVTPLIPPMS